MFWADIETHAGVYNFSWYDQLVASLKARGMAAHFILCYGNAVYTGTDWFQPPRTLAATQGFANFAWAAAVHYAGQGVHFEIWNEPDVAAFWNPPDAAAYSGPVPDRRRAGPRGGRGGGGVLRRPGRPGPRFLDGMVTNQGSGKVNAVAIHPYRHEIPEGLTNDMAAWRAALAAAFPAHAPAVWSTEEGYSSAWYGDGTLPANRTTQAKLGVRQILTGLGLGLPVQIVFDLRDVGTDAANPEQNFGVVTASYQPKPLTAAVQTLLNACKGHTFSGILPSPKSDVHILKFEGPSDTLLVMWSEAPTGTAQRVYFPTLPGQALDYLGNPLMVVQGGVKRRSIKIKDAPVYVIFPGSL